MRSCSRRTARAWAGAGNSCCWVQGLALAAYAARELEPGPGYLGFFALAIFVIVAAQTGGETFGGERSQSLVGWPLAVGIGTVLAALWGARPGPARA